MRTASISSLWWTATLLAGCVRYDVPSSLTALRERTDIVLLDRALQGRLVPHHDSDDNHFEARLSQYGGAPIALSCTRSFVHTDCAHDRLTCSAPDGTSFEFDFDHGPPASGTARVAGVDYTVRSQRHRGTDGNPTSYLFTAPDGTAHAALITRDDDGLVLVPRNQPDRTVFVFLANVLYESLDPAKERAFRRYPCERGL